MENLPDELVQLIDRFKEHLEQYKGVSYDEANTRTDFIDPLFKLLGWKSRYGRHAGLVALPGLPITWNRLNARRRTGCSTAYSVMRVATLNTIDRGR